MRDGHIFNDAMSWKLFAAVCVIWVGLVFAIGELSGCAGLKHVVKSVDDVASAACELFATEHPDEFAVLVSQVKPSLSETVRYQGFNIREVCAVHEVLKPFIDSQLALQQQTVMGVRASMGNPNAPAP